MSLASLPVRNEEECVDALTKALEEAYPDLEVTVLVLRLIAKFTPYRKWLRGSFGWHFVYMFAVL